jgi:hypothetical protein
MKRPVAMVILALASTACAEDDPPPYVVRLDLDQVAAATAKRDASPGFESLGPGRRETPTGPQRVD